jgi:competence protein ComEA
MKHVYRAVAGLVIALLCIPASARAQANPEVTKKVNINSADSSQLSMLPRVGPSLADRIVEYRKDNGPFKKPEDLMLVQGVGEKTFQLIKPYIATSGDTTLKEKAGSSRSGKSSKGKGSRTKSPKAPKTKGAPGSDAGKVASGRSARQVSGTPAKAAKKSIRAPKAPKPTKSKIRRGFSGAAR